MLKDYLKVNWSNRRGRMTGVGVGKLISHIRLDRHFQALKWKIMTKDTVFVQEI
jgi:hypothetical protein